MDDEIIAQLISLVLVATVFVVISAALNLIFRKCLPRRHGFGYWSTNLLTVPAISAAYGLYQYFNFASPSCVPDTYHCFFMLDPLVQSSDALLFIVIIPVASLCFAIPTTMWFVSKNEKK